MTCGAPADFRSVATVGSGAARTSVPPRRRTTRATHMSMSAAHQSIDESRDRSTTIRVGPLAACTSSSRRNHAPSSTAARPDKDTMVHALPLTVRVSRTTTSRELTSFHIGAYRAATY